MGKKLFVVGGRAMSWQGYIDTLEKQDVDAAAIIGFNGASWAASPDSLLSRMTVEEGVALVAAFQKPSEFVRSGVVVGGKAFLFIRNSDRSVLGKLATETVLCVRTQKAVVVALFHAKNLSHCSAVVEKLA